MVFCTVKNCRSSYDSNGGISFHRFPKSAELRRLWLCAIGESPDKVVRQQAVCSRHFELDHFKRNAKRTSLEKGAVPTLNLPTENGSPTPETDESQNSEDLVNTIEVYIEDYNTELTELNRNHCSEDTSTNHEYRVEPYSMKYVDEIHNYSVQSKNTTEEVVRLKRLLSMKRKKIKVQSQRVRRLEKRVTKMRSVIDDLKERLELSLKTHQFIISGTGRKNKPFIVVE